MTNLGAVSELVKKAFSVLRNTTYWILPLAVALVLAVALFFINFKKKTGLIYITVAFALIGILLFGISFAISPIIHLVLPDYEVIAKPIIADIKTTMLVIGIVYIVISVGCIVATRLLAGKKKNARGTERTEEA